MTSIQDYLIKANPWWKKPFHALYKEREIFEKLNKFLPLRQIIALVGLRRTGKTTILHKIIETKLTDDFDPTHILYVSFDEYGEIMDLNEIVKVYEDLHRLEIQNGKYLVAFDEIQKLKNWENQIKTLYDLHPEVKIIISGSESLYIQKISKETLAGRIFLFKIHPLTFKEYVTFSEKTYSSYSLYKRELEQLWNDYLLTQGFPELLGIKDQDIIQKYLQESLLEKIIYKEIPQSINVKNPALLESILHLISNNPGQIMEPSKFCSDLHTTRQTLVLYLKYLENAFLIQKVYNFSKNQKKVERKLKRYYPAIISVDMTFSKQNLTRSKVFEWTIIRQLQIEFFWRNSAQNEVDAIKINKDGSITPIEIKYGKIQTKGMINFLKNFDLNEGVILSKDSRKLIEEKGKKIQVIPAIKYLFFSSNS